MEQTSQVQFESDAPIMAYHIHDQNSCCFGSLASALKASNNFFAEISIPTCIYSSLTDAILDRIKFTNAIITYKGGKLEQHIFYKLER